MLKALKIRLYPNKTQEAQINKLLGCYRFVYNQCLNKKITSYEKNKTSENLTSLGHYLHAYLTKQDIYFNCYSIHKDYITGGMHDVHGVGEEDLRLIND